MKTRRVAEHSASLMNLNHVLKKSWLSKLRGPIFNLIFSEYTMCPDNTATPGSWAGDGLVN
jgi:hypothetical protein